MSDKKTSEEELSFRKRISAAIKSNGKSKDIASITGIPEKTLDKYIQQISTPSAVNAAKIAVAVGSTVEEWLNPENSELERKKISKSGGLIWLPIYDVAASAGFGANVSSHENQIATLAVDEALLRNFGASPNQCQLIRAEGDSMMPTIPDGSLLVVDLGQKDIVSGRIVVINVNGDLLVKRIDRRINGDIYLVSDNSFYTPQILTEHDAAQIHIIGRVVSLIRSL